MYTAYKPANMKKTCPYKSVKNALWQRALGQASPERSHLSTKALQECTQAKFPWTGLLRAVMQGVNYSLNQKSPSTFIGIGWPCEADWQINETEVLWHRRRPYTQASGYSRKRSMELSRAPFAFPLLSILFVRKYF